MIMETPQVDIRHILYATDLSENALHAFAYASSLAHRYDAKITFLHVFNELPDRLDRGVLGYITESRWEDIKGRYYDDARQSLIGKRREHHMLREVLTRFSEKSGLAAEGDADATGNVIVKTGNPVEEILTTAEEQQCDMVVMGSNGYGTFTDALMGGTVRRVVRHAKIPVLVVRPPEEK
jgi:nucleotide-binding universal stress UspA family protein